MVGGDTEWLASKASKAIRGVFVVEFLCDFCDEMRLLDDFHRALMMFAGFYFVMMGIRDLWVIYPIG